MDPARALAKMLHSDGTAEQARRVADLKHVAIEAVLLRDARTKDEFVSAVAAVSEAVGHLKWMTGTDPLPGIPV